MALKNIATGFHNFAEIIEKNCYFVDKTKLIKTVFTSKDKALLLLRPRRFGKTLTLSMFQHFLSMNLENPDDLSHPKRLFADLQIAKDLDFCKGYMGKYPVISITLKGVVGSTFEIAYKKLAAVILDCADNIFSSIKSYSQNHNIKLSKKDEQLLELLTDRQFIKDPSNCDELTAALKNLTAIISRCYGKDTIILIDEYDVPLNNASNHGYYAQMIDIIRDLLCETLKDNTHLEQSVITGCLRISKESIFTGMNNLIVNTIFDTNQDLAVGIGFTKEETKEMLDYYDLSEFNELVKNNYDGYNFYNNDLFCAWDVINFCNNTYGKPKDSDIFAQNYWINTSENQIIDDFLDFMSADDLAKMQKLVDDESISVQVNLNMTFRDQEDHHSEDFWSILLYAGYLTIEKGSSFDPNYPLILKIPNKSIKRCFEHKILDHYKYNRKYLASWNVILESLLIGDAKGTMQALNDVLPMYISVRDFSSNGSKEQVYHALMNGFFIPLKPITKDFETNQESGLGYPDITFKSHDRRIGVVIEIKQVPNEIEMKKSSTTALLQIEEKRYYEKLLFTDQLSKVYAYGISFCGKKCYVACQDLSKKILTK